MKPYREYLLAMLVLLAPAAPAARIGVYDAESAARAFAARGRHLAPGLGSSPRETREHSAADGSRFFSVRMAGGGTVFLSGDDAREPVIAFSPADIDYDGLDRGSPLRALLGRDAAARPDSADAPSKWRRMLASGDSLPAYPSLLSVVLLASGLTEPGDVRVPALVGTKWNQKRAGGSNCYNLYTPGNVYCGCVATSMSQVMRYHRWPDSTKSVSAKTFACSYNGTATNLTMQGGVYDWAQMPYGTSEDPISTDAQRRAIGKLTSDAGISVKMAYSSSGSGAYDASVVDALMKTWRYSQATYLNDYQNDYGSAYGYINGDRGAESRRRTLQQALFADFDCGYPVMLGISNDSDEGHSIVADGYGYEDGVDYVHLNLGWSGSDDLWYNLPAIGTVYGFGSVDDVIYNIFPTNGTSYAAFSGRVVDAATNAVASAKVSVYRHGTTERLGERATSDAGVFGFVLRGGWSYDVVAVAADGSSTGRLVNVSLSAPVTERYSICSRVVTPDGTIGNSWGNDITLGAESRERTAPTNFYVSASTGVDAPHRGTSAAPYATIQYAITNGQTLVAGDTIRVLPGCYRGCVEAPETEISIVATGGPNRTLLDGGGNDCCYSGENNSASLLVGFTVTNGAYYGGVYCGTAVDCRICGNWSKYGGGASYSVLTNCLVCGNAAYCIRERWFCDGGDGGGAYECDLFNCTLAGNYADYYGGGAFLHQYGEARNSVVCGNWCAGGTAYGDDVYGNHYWTMSNSLSDVDARFRDAANGDYRITPSSPAFDAGSPDFVSIDHDFAGTNRVWGDGVDIGCYEYHLPSSATTDPTNKSNVAAALAREGYRAAYAEAVTTAKDYAYLVEWTADNGLTAAELNASPTGFISPALAANGLLALDPTNIVFRGFSVSGSGTDWSVAVSLPGYDPATANLALLKSAFGVIGSDDVKTGYSSGDLVWSVTPASSNVLVNVQSPADKSRYFLKVRVR